MKWHRCKDDRWTVMTDSHREQHPLLYDDLSEEEQFGPHFQRQYRPMVFRGRARNNAKGAAAIIKHWPEFWSSSLTYWWIGLAMLAVVTFLIYNSIAAFAMLPSDHFRGRLKTTNNAKESVFEESSISTNVFMHQFVQYNKKFDLNSFMPYVHIIADKYPDFIYNFIIITNDTDVETNFLSAEENNEIALNSLWSRNNVDSTEKANVNIQHLTLSKYLDNSPIRKYWRSLPYQFIEFLTRAVSVWDKGGIAFNPNILTPRSPHAAYIEKIQNILQNYPRLAKENSKDRQTNKRFHRGYKKKVNNIRDIINALEHTNDELSTSEENLVEAENKYDILTTNDNRKSDIGTEEKHTTRSNFPQNVANKILNDSTNVSFNYKTDNPAISKDLRSLDENIDNDFNQPPMFNNTNGFGLLPMFLDFIFQNKPNVKSSISDPKVEPIILTRKRKHVSSIDKKNEILMGSYAINKNESEILKPIVISAKTLKNDSTGNIRTNNEEAEDANQFTIDLKGNIIASVIPCHAFLGTIFSNSVHHSQESLRDFIITELSIFCKGVLSSCNGIDVILL